MEQVPDGNPAVPGIFGRLAPHEARTGRVHVIVDTPAGSGTKFKFDPQFQVFRVSRVLPKGCVFPGDFGFVPATCADDGDALDVLVLDSGPSFPGCLLTVRLIGVIRARQRESGRTIANDRLIGLVETKLNRARTRELREVDPEKVRAVEHFFASYNAFEGRHFEIVGRAGEKRAQALLRQAIRVHRQRDRL
jgi:inorganic pyrophosphatase